MIRIYNKLKRLKCQAEIIHSGNLRMFTYFIQKYFANHLSRPLKELYASAAIFTFAVSAITIFEPIYLYRLGFSLRDIFLFYGAVYVGYLFALPIGAKTARAMGYEHAMFASSPFLIIYYLSLFAIPYNKVFIPIAIGAFIFQKIFFWPAYHADFARHGERAERGREITTMGLLLTVAGLAGPIVGGLVISAWGFKPLFIASAIIVLLSNIPMLTTPEKFVPVDFSYRAAWKRLWSVSFRQKFLAGISYTEDLLVMVAWPVFIFSVVPSFTKIGAIVSGASLLVAVLLLAVGRLTDERSRSKILRVGVILTVGSWIMRPLLVTPVGIFISDIFYKFSRSFVGIPLAASVYDRAKETSVMETVIAYEMALSFGKALGAFAAAFVAVWFSAAPWVPLFVLAGVASMSYAKLIDRS